MLHDAEYFYRRSQEYFEHNNVADGFLNLEEAIHLDPANSDYYWARGLRRYEQKELELALLDFTTVSEIASDTDRRAEAYRRKIFCYFFLDKCEDLISDANQLIEQGTQESKIYELRGYCKSQLGQFEEAIDDYLTAVRLRWHYDTLFGRARTFYRAKRYVEAIHDLTDILSSSDVPSNYLAKVYQLRAMCHYHLNNFEESFSDYNQVQLLHGLEQFTDLGLYIESIKNLELYLSKFDQ
jgi:tetratricopeptide (TPR) repeat protein